MGDIPYSDRLIKGFKAGIVRVIGVGIGLLVAMNVPGAGYWRGAIFLGVVAVYWLIVWLLQLAWLRHRRSPN
jgi:hypothetical protein